MAVPLGVVHSQNRQRAEQKAAGCPRRRNGKEFTRKLT